MSTLPKSIDDTLALLASADYVAERSLASPNERRLRPRPRTFAISVLPIAGLAVSRHARLSADPRGEAALGDVSALASRRECRRSTWEACSYANYASPPAKTFQGGKPIQGAPRV